MAETTPNAECAFEEWWNRDDVPPGHTSDMVPREVPYAAFMSAWQNRAEHATPLMKAVEALLAVVNESVGIVGWHLNGAVAEWGEFEFISDLQAALEATEGGAG